MSPEVILLTQGDPKEAQRIFASFAERTALEAEPVMGGMRFALDRGRRKVRVLETLAEIDAKWELHVALG